MDSGLLSNNQFLPPQSTGQNTPPQSGGRFKLGKRAVIGLVASAVAVGGYLVMAGKQNIWPFRVDEVVVDSFTDWKTYRNEQYGFELKIPQEFGKSNGLKPYNTWVKDTDRTFLFQYDENDPKLNTIRSMIQTFKINQSSL